MGNQQRRSRSQEREQFWRKLIAGQPGSGMSVQAWCGEHGVSAASFYLWRQKLAKPDARRESGRPSLLPVEIIRSEADDSRAPLEIELPSRVKLRVRPGCEPEFLRQVLMMLQRRETEEC